MARIPKPKATKIPKTFPVRGSNANRSVEPVLPKATKPKANKAKTSVKVNQVKLPKVPNFKAPKLPKPPALKKRLP